MPSSLPRRRTAVRLLAVPVLAALVASLTVVSTGAAPAGDLTGHHAGIVGAETPEAGQAAVSVTLVTGDVVLVTRAGDGTPSALFQGEGDHYAHRVGDDLYVIPAGAQPALAADRLDVELFNVTSLVEQGYDDEQAAELPLIVEGSLPRTRSAAIQVAAELDSADSTAVRVAKDQLRAAYADLVGSRGRAATSVEKVWLDAKVRPTGELDPATGVGQTGAPEAWDLGYDGTGTTVAVLDTGYDPEHPDLAGRVRLAQDFTGQGVEDQDGHGTHVASTVAGTGAADPSKVGMAPGADLIVGKVLGWSGGQTSWIIAGMEWAVAQGADAVNMSLGSGAPTDCTDPMAQATAALTEQTGTLFVIAAGNSGAKQTVSSPGCVEGALTVGAVDPEGGTAPFSSRGSVLGNHDIKPDIAAPGVQIVGAQAGSPGGIDYTVMSGTSMASPHVAGAAAILREAHPDWTAQQVKAALVGSVKASSSGTVNDQGAGELWVPDALDATVTSDVGVELADFDWPHGRDERAVEQVRYTNDSDAPVRLQLRLRDLAGADGRGVPSDLIRLKDQSVTVPPRGSRTIDVEARGNTDRLRDSAYGEISARIVATGRDDDGQVRVTTAVGLWLEPETVTVTLRVLDRTGAPATSGTLDITDMHQPTRALHQLTGEDIELRVRAGSYHLTTFIRTQAADGSYSYTYLGDPDARFSRDTTRVLDARRAEKVTVRGDRPMEIGSGSFGVQRTFDGWIVGTSLFAQRDPTFYAAGTDRRQRGDFRFGTYLRAYQPDVATQDSPYVYNLAFVDDERVSSDQSHRVSDRRLGSATEHWHSQRTPWEAEEWSRVVTDNGTGPFYSSSSDRVAAPGTRTAYFTPSIPWQQHSSSGGFRTRPETWFDPVRTYRAGQHRESEWLKMPSLTAMAVNRDGSPARIAERQGSLVGFAFPTWQDTTPGRFAAGGFGDIGGLSLWKDGVFVGHNGWPSGQADIGEGEHELTVEVGMQRLSRSTFWELGRGARTRFTFRTARPEGDTTAALPIALPRYDAPVDEHNLAPAGPEFPVSVAFHGQDGYDPGAIGSFTAKVSFDDIDPFGDVPLEDHTWTEIPVVQRDGAWVALVDNTGAAGKVASLVVTAEDAHGTEYEQYVVGVYGVEG